MIFTPTKLKGSNCIEPKLFEDDRGWFARTFCKEEFEKNGLEKDWVQLNHSFTKQKGTIRGMHYQLPPFAEVKLVRCIAGAVFDVIVDIRKNSSTFLQWEAVELSAANKKMLYIPEGFAHGFQALTDNVELIYHHSNFYKPNVEAGLNYNDEVLKINWPLTVTSISDRDKQHNYINEDFVGI
jgi:dTDP-4-dehydrorhamnose 3,5-epimerase